MIDAPHDMVHAAHKPGPNARAPYFDRLMCRVVLPAVVLIGLYGLIRYALSGQRGDTLPGYQMEQPLAPPQ